MTGAPLLENAILYKVGYHGSHNATLKKNGLELVKKLRVAMILVDQTMAKKKRWNHMPLDERVMALNKQAKGVVLRVDQPMPPSREQVTEAPSSSRSLCDNTARSLPFADRALWP